MRDIINNEIYMKPNFLTSLRYEQLKNWAVGKAVIKDAINRWEALGFLEGIEDEVKKEALAIAFDNMAHDLAVENEKIIKIEKRYNFNCSPDDDNTRYNGYQFNFSIAVFPILRRVICGNIHDKKATYNFTYDKFIDILEKLSFLAINYDGYEHECDIEAEFVSILSNIIIELFNK